MTTAIGLIVLSSNVAAKTLELSGYATVIDGDTVVVSGKKIRMLGVDAPEKNQPCKLAGKAWYAGRDATAWLKSQAEGRVIYCSGDGRPDKYKRKLMTCFRDGLNLNAAVIANGWGYAYRRYSLRYVPEEEAAKSQKLGVWRGHCQFPEHYRHSNKSSKKAPK